MATKKPARKGSAKKSASKSKAKPAKKLIGKDKKHGGIHSVTPSPKPPKRK